ncbi:hypothetical protein BJ742DRAFT_835030, partial [Cladochytrium replicatum]
MVAPIVGRFRNRIYRDLVGSITAGSLLGAYWWYGMHEPAFAKYKVYIDKVHNEIEAEHDAWRATL